MQVRSVVASLRQPEYTGENRCGACTVVNLLIVTVAVAGTAVAVGGFAAAAVGVFGVLVLYFRGYVVPGTPALTRRYLPDRVLAWFDHGPVAAGDAGDGVEQAAAGGNGEYAGGEFDPEVALVDAGALEPCVDRDDLCLDPVFRADWRTAMRNVDSDFDAAFADMLPGDVTKPVRVETTETAVRAHVGDATVATWPSRAAFVADAAGAAVLADRDPEWRDRSFREQTRLLAGLRLWLDECAVCGGRVNLGEETVESCCRSRPVVAASCTSCGARIFEAPLPDE